ncbi:MAG: hypothetical protein F6K42_16655 [Leptolyngbya sp. SIO1D8]|nr:hypothetical protein [Leptolyngbya sp. SIO1D8]
MKLVSKGSLLRLDCVSEATWIAVCRDRRKLSALNIGVKGILVAHPNHADFLIEMDLSPVQRQEG